jgi:hypothetical protein
MIPQTTPKSVERISRAKPANVAKSENPSIKPPKVF